MTKEQWYIISSGLFIYNRSFSRTWLLKSNWYGYKCLANLFLAVFNSHRNSRVGLNHTYWLLIVEVVSVDLVLVMTSWAILMLLYVYPVMVHILLF